MNHDQFQEWQSGMDLLDPVQKQQVQIFLSEITETAVSLETMEARLAEHRQCPHCNTPGAVSRGTPRGLRRYRCKSCKKTFNAATDTILQGIKRKGKWLMFRESLADGLSIRATARRCSISIRTAFRWHRRLLDLKKQSFLKSENTEKIGEYVIPVSEPETLSETLSETSPETTGIEIIRKIVSQHLKTGMLSILIDKPEFPCSYDDLKTALSAISKKSGPSTPSGIALMAILEDLRTKDLTMVCTNNGPRHVASMEAWNAWVKDGNRAEGLSRNALYSAPAFMALQYCISDRIEYLSTEHHAETSCTENDFSQALDDIRENMVLYLAGQKAEMDLVPGRHDQCLLTGHRLNYGSDPLSPCLMELGRTLPRLKTPPLVRHIILDLPSEEMIAGQFSRIRGFEKGLRALVGTGTSAIIQAMKYAMTYDIQMKKCIRKTGMAVLRCDNMSDMRFSPVQDDVWCAGYPVAGNQIGTSPGLMYFADPEILVDVIMESGLYPRRSTAKLEMETCLEHPDYGMNCLPIPNVRTLNIYAPSGYSILNGNGLHDFRAKGFSNETNEYPCGLFSAIPLEVSDETMGGEPWSYCV